MDYSSNLLDEQLDTLEEYILDFLYQSAYMEY